MVGADDAARLAADLVGPGATVSREGAGWDHVAWRVVGADGIAWIVRGPATDDGGDPAADVHREVAVMQAARTVLGDLVADAIVLDASVGCLAHVRVPGVPLQGLLAAGRVPVSSLDRLGQEIGGIIATIGGLPAPGGVTAEDGLAAWFAELPAFVATVDRLLSPGERAAVARFLVTPPPVDPDPGDLRLAHNDLGAEHVLVDPDTLAITGIIDWSDAARADQAAEVGRLVRDLGGDHADAVLDGMGASGADRAGLDARGWCYARCLVLEDLAYAVRHRPDLVVFERASLAALFAGV
jgi:aminoglycoside phosphotransferase (APT) family kinase protein